MKKLMNRIKFDFFAFFSFLLVITALLLFFIDVKTDFKASSFNWLALLIVFAALYVKDVIISKLEKRNKGERYFMVSFKGTVTQATKNAKGEIIMDEKTKLPMQRQFPFEGAIYMTGTGHPSYTNVVHQIQSEMKNKSNGVENIMVLNLHEFNCKEDMKNWTGHELQQ